MWFREKFRNVRKSLRWAQWRDDPHTFYRLGIGLIAVSIVVIAFAKQPSYCKNSGVNVCSRITPSVGFGPIAAVFILLGLAGFSIWHGREIRKYAESYIEQPTDRAEPGRLPNDWR